MTINERIKRRRKQLGLSAEDVANFLGISRATLYRYESADIEKIPAGILEDISVILKTTPMYLLGVERSGDKEKITFDDFTYAMYGESRDLTDDEKAQLINMAKFMKSERKRRQKGNK